MIRFSKMADYGVLLLGHMARQGDASVDDIPGSPGHAGTGSTGANGHDELTSASELADSLHMSRSVVSNLLKAFREAGLLESKRGLHGGYRLTRSPAGISLLEVLRAIDGPVQLTDCAVVDLATACEFEDVCSSKSPLLAVNQRIVEMLESMSLADLQNEPGVEAASRPSAAATAPSPNDRRASPVNGHARPNRHQTSHRQPTVK